MKLNPGPAATIRTLPHNPWCANDRALILLCGRLGFIFAEQLDIATERNGGEEIFGFAHLSAENLRSESKRELQDLDADPASGQEMSEFMERD